MNAKEYSSRIRRRIASSVDGKLFVMSDFADIAPNNVANRIVLRLLEERRLRLIARGIYQKPKVNSLLGEPVEPSVDEVAAAIARKNGWTICPSGDTALNLLGVSEQVPAVWRYLSSGPYKTYPFGAGIIVFTHTANRMTSGLSADAALLVQALRALGETYANEENIGKMAKRFTPLRLGKIERQTRNVPDWIHMAIMRMKELQHA